MKLMLFMLMLSGTAFAKNFFPFGKVGSSKVYKSKADCEAAEGQKCFKIFGKDLRRVKIGFKKPKADETIDCLNADNCQTLIDDGAISCDQPAFDDKANWPGLDFGEFRSATGWFAWCQVEGLVLDAAKNAAADAEDNAKAEKKATRQAKKLERRTLKDACVAAVNDGGNLNQGQIKGCIEVLVKEVFESEIPASDL